MDFDVRWHRGTPPEGLTALAAAAGASVFHTPGWMSAVAVAAPHLEVEVLAVQDRAGMLRAACPLLVARRWGVLRAYAGAWGTYGGIVGTDRDAEARAQAALAAFAASPRVALVRVHDFGASLAGAPQWRETPETCQVLDLPADAQTLFHDAFTSQNRNKIRKAEKSGVTVQRGNDADALVVYARLYAESSARWGLERPLPPAFFASLAAVPGLDVWIASSGDEPIAALLNFTFGGQVMNWGNVSRRGAWGASPNNLLHWRALQAACADVGGPRLYNFGGSTGLPGVETFKSAFGAREHVYARRERRARWLAIAERFRRDRAGKD